MPVQSGTAIRDFVDEVRRQLNIQHGKLAQPVIRGEFDGRDYAYDRRIGVLDGLRQADAILLEALAGYGGKEAEDNALRPKRRKAKPSTGKSWEIDNPPPPRAPQNGAQT